MRPHPNCFFLCLPSLQGSVLLTIGYHQLEGKRMELKKPFAVLDRVTGSGSGEEGQDSTQYKVPRRVRWARCLLLCAGATRRSAAH